MRVLPALAAAAALLAADGGFERLMREGLVELSGGRLDWARTRLENASELQPDNPRVWLALAQTYAKLQMEAEAKDAAEKASSLGGDDPVVLHGLAIHYTDIRAWEQAASAEAKYAAATHSAEAFSRAASLYLQAGSAKRAIESARAGLALEAGAELHNILGKAYEMEGASGAAIRELQEAIRLNRYEERYYFDLVQLLLAHQNFDVAVTMVEKSREVFARSAQLELAQGVAYYGLRRFSDAVESFLKAAELAPSAPQPYVFLGRILSHAGDRLPEIERRFAAFAGANPDSAAGPLLHAKALIAQLPPAGFPPRAEKAAALLKKSLSIQADDAEPHFELALLQERQRQFEEAARSLERSIALDPKNPASHYRLARIYDRLGRSEDAARERELHRRLTAEEKTALERHAATIKRLDLAVRDRAEVRK